MHVHVAGKDTMLLLTIYVIFLTNQVASFGKTSYAFVTSQKHRVKVKSLVRSNKDEGVDETALSRREILALSLGGVAYAKVVASAISKIKRGDAYPEEHESRVSHVFQRSITESYMSMRQQESRPLRILEIGIGENCRTINRGLYDNAFAQLSTFPETHQLPGIEFFGVDLDEPTLDMFQSAKKKIETALPNVPISFHVQTGDLVKGLTFPDGYFGKIWKALVYCRVTSNAKDHSHNRFSRRGNMLISSL